MKRTLFDLHRSVRIFEINDGHGEPIQVGFLAPSHAVQSRLMMALNDAKREAEIEAGESGLAKQFLAQAGFWTKDQLISLILRLELGATDDEADLAPNSETTEASDAVDPDAQRLAEEQEAVKRRQERRQVILESYADADLHQIYVELQIKLAVLTQATGRWSIMQLCAVVVEPEPDAHGRYQPMFSAREESIGDICAQCGRGTPAENYIGNLMPETMNALSEARNTFFADMSEKSIRKQAEEAAFLSSGKSGKKRRAFRGGIGQIPRTSPRSRSASSAAESG